MKSYLKVHHVLTVLSFAIVSPINAASNRPPNILFILADDLGMECIGAHGGESYPTPNIDRLANTGMRFDHAFANPICTPTRVQLMTGLYNVRNYVKFGVFPKGAATFANQLRKAGYATAMAGKWQLGTEPEAPRNGGFNEYLLWQHLRGRTREGTEFDSRYPNPDLELNGRPLPTQEGEYGPDILTRFLEKFIEKNRDQPFLAYYSMLLPHCPFSPTPDSEEWEPKSPGASVYKGDPKFFADMVAHIDRSVGELVAKLEELGLRDNTIVIFTGDNGTDRPIVSRWRGREIPGGKGRLHDNGMRVPLIVSWPGHIPPHSVCEELVDFADFLPTFCELSGAPLPSGYTGDGVSLVPALLGLPGREKPWIYCWYEESVMARDHHQMVLGPQDGTNFKFYELPTPYEEKLIPQDALSSEQATKQKFLLDQIERFSTARPRSASE